MKKLFIFLSLLIPIVVFGQQNTLPSGATVAGSVTNYKGGTGLTSRLSLYNGGYWYQLLTLQDTTSLLATKYYASHYFTFNNGLTNTAGVVQLGGPLLSPTFINGNNQLFYIGTTTGFLALGPHAVSSGSTFNNVQTNFTAGSSTGEVSPRIYMQRVNSTGGISSINIDSAGVHLRDDSLGHGILYTKINFSTLIDSSLVPKKYVDHRTDSASKYKIDSLNNAIHNNAQTVNGEWTFNSGIIVPSGQDISTDRLDVGNGGISLNGSGNLDMHDSRILNSGQIHIQDDLGGSNQLGIAWSGGGATIGNATLNTGITINSDRAASFAHGNYAYSSEIPTTPSGGFAANDSTLKKNKNLYDVPNKATARTNLGAQRRFITNVDSLAKGDGVTDDYAAIAAVIATGKPIQFTAGKRYKISAALNPLPGQYIEGNQASLLINHTHGINLADSVIVDGLRITGSGKGSPNVNEIGFYQKKAKGVRIINCITDSMAYRGYYADSTVNQPGSGNINYRPSTITNSFFYNSVAGYVTGKRGEYVYVNGCVFAGNDTAMVKGGGNNHDNATQFVYNGINIFLKNAGANDSHSSSNGSVFNHPTGTGNYNIIADSITYNYQFNNCTMLVGQVLVKNSGNIQFTGGLYSPKSITQGITNINTKLKMVNVTFMASTPYTESGGGTHDFTKNVLSYNNITVTPTQFSADSILYTLNPATSSITANTLATARNINGVAFNGSANITVPADWTTLSNLPKFVSVDGNNLNNITNLSTPDLNLLTGTQFAYCSSPTNGPSGNGWVSVAQKDANVIFETFFNTTGSEFFRVTTTGNAGWGAWKKILNDGTVVSVAQGGTGVTTATGTGSVVLSTSPSLTTPNLNVATITSVNKVAITTPATSATLTIANGKTLTYNNSITIAGTDATTMTFPTTSASIARTDAAQTFVGTNTFPGLTLSGSVNLSSDNAYTIGASGSRLASLFVSRAKPNILQINTTDIQFQNTSGTILGSFLDSDGSFHLGSTATNGEKLQVDGNLSLTTAGNKIKIATGSNASVGTATLSGGTVTVNTTAVTSSSKIFLTPQTTGALTNIGVPTVGTIVNGTSFVINSSNVLDTSNVNWFIIN